MEIIQNTARINREGANLLAAGEERKALEAFSQGLHMITGLASQVDIDQLRIMQLAEQQQQQQQLLLRQQQQQANDEMMEQPNDERTISKNDTAAATTQEKEQPISSTTETSTTSTTPPPNTNTNSNGCCCAEGDQQPQPQGYQHCFVSDVTIDGLCDDQFYIHNKAIVFHPPTISPYANLTFYSAVLLCNMALCYHRRYMSTQKAVMQDMALQLYDGCCQSMKEYCHAVDERIHSILIIALNNQGQLLFDNMDRRYQTITNEMTTIIRQSHKVQDIHSQILLNILMCGTLKGAGTAAA